MQNQEKKNHRVLVKALKFLFSDKNKYLKIIRAKNTIRKANKPQLPFYYFLCCLFLSEHRREFCMFGVKTTGKLFTFSTFELWRLWTNPRTAQRHFPTGIYSIHCCFPASFFCKPTQAHTCGFSHQTKIYRTCADKMHLYSLEVHVRFNCHFLILQKRKAEERKKLVLRE